jgi:hypothetical protein
MEILTYKKTTDKDLKINMQVCYQNLDGVFCKLGTITDILLIDNVKNYLINTSFGSYLASELKLIKQ